MASTPACAYPVLATLGTSGNLCCQSGLWNEVAIWSFVCADNLGSSVFDHKSYAGKPDIVYGVASCHWCHTCTLTQAVSSDVGFKLNQLLLGRWSHKCITVYYKMNNSPVDLPMLPLEQTHCR